MHRQADDALHQALGHRQALRPARIHLIGRLQVQRDRVVDRRGDALGLQVRGQAVAVLVLDGVLRPVRDIARRHVRHGGDMGAQALVVAGGDAVAPFDLLTEDLQLLDQDGGLDGVQTAVQADAHVQILRVVVEGLVLQVDRHRLAVDADGIDQLGQVVVIGQHRPAVAVAAQGLGREEAGGGDVGPFQRVLAVDGAAKTLGRVRDQLQAVLVADGLDGRIVGGLAEQVDGDDHARFQTPFLQRRLDGGLQMARVHVVGRLVHVDEDRLGVEPGHDLGGGREGEAGHEDGVAATNAPGHQRQGQGVGAVGAAQGVLGLTEGGQIGLELAHLRAHDPGAADDGLLNGGLDLAAEAKALGLKVDEGNGHEGSLSRWGAALAELGSARGREGGSTLLSASYQSPGPLDKPARVTSRCRLQRKPCLAKPATLPKPTGR
ncbi:hypothetical protein D3C85_1046230 [compost metagenome]